jgi:hypothetical protein
VTHKFNRFYLARSENILLLNYFGIQSAHNGQHRLRREREKKKGKKLCHLSDFYIFTLPLTRRHRNTFMTPAFIT